MRHELASKLQPRLFSLFLALMLAITLLTGCQGVPPGKRTPTPTVHTTLRATTGTATAGTATTGTVTPPTPSLTPTRTITPTPTPYPPIQVKINASLTIQVLREVAGGNFVHYFGGIQTALDPVSTLNLATLSPKIVRTRMELNTWEPSPGVPSSSRFQNSGLNQATFEFMQQVKQGNSATTLIASIWDAPNWMVSNPDAESNRVLAPEFYKATADSIANWLVTARDEYGVEVDYVSINEPNIGTNLKLSPQELVDFIRIAGPRFKDYGLKTRFLLGDTGTMASALTYIAPIIDAEDIRDYLGPISIHSWDIQTDDQLLQAIGKYAEQNRLEVWCTAAGWDPSQWNRPEEFATWKHALNLAAIDTRVILDTRATALLYWQMAGRDYPINDGSQPYPALLYLKELQTHFPAGSQVVKLSGDPTQNATVLALAARTPEHGFSVQLVNQSSLDREVILSGLPEGTYNLVRMWESEGREELDPVTVKQQMTLEIPAQSILFLSLNAQ